MLVLVCLVAEVDLLGRSLGIRCGVVVFATKVSGFGVGVRTGVGIGGRAGEWVWPS